MKPIEIITIRRRPSVVRERIVMSVPAPRPRFVDRARRSAFARDAARSAFADARRPR